MLENCWVFWFDKKLKKIKRKILSLIVTSTDWILVDKQYFPLLSSEGAAQQQKLQQHFLAPSVVDGVICSLARLDSTHFSGREMEGQEQEDDDGFRHVLVVGASCVGKTTFLSYLEHGRDGEYVPTTEMTEYVDVKNKLIFIDTPGIKDEVLNMSMPEHICVALDAFDKSQLVKEVTGKTDIYHSIHPADLQLRHKVTGLNKISAVLILYSDCPRSVATAKALRLKYYHYFLDKVIDEREQHQDWLELIKPFHIFCVHNVGLSDNYERNRGRPPPPRGPVKQQALPSDINSDLTRPIMDDNGKLFGDDNLMDKDIKANCFVQTLTKKVYAPNKTNIPTTVAYISKVVHKDELGRMREVEENDPSVVVFEPVTKEVVTAKERKRVVRGKDGQDVRGACAGGDCIVM